MWKIVVFVVSGAPTADLYGVNNMVFFDKSECETTASQIEALAPEEQFSIRATCVEGLFMKFNGD